MKAIIKNWNVKPTLVFVYSQFLWYCLLEYDAVVRVAMKNMVSYSEILHHNIIGLKRFEIRKPL